jgi:hypothetical protein
MGFVGLLLRDIELLLAFHYVDSESTNIPEPATIVILGVGLACLAAIRRVNRRRLLGVVSRRFD